MPSAAAVLRADGDCHRRSDSERCDVAFVVHARDGWRAGRPGNLVLRCIRPSLRRQREPDLTLDLLRLTNSAASGLTTWITSLRHAISVLGRRQLQRWLQLLIYANADSGKAGKSMLGASPLLQLAATRGRLMELLAERVQAGNREFADQSFMVGILSLMPTLLGMKMPEILAQLPFAQRVRLALTERTGQFRQLLVLVESTEHADAEALDEAVAPPARTARFLDSRLALAMTWANNAVWQEQNTNDE